MTERKNHKREKSERKQAESNQVPNRQVTKVELTTSLIIVLPFTIISTNVATLPSASANEHMNLNGELIQALLSEVTSLVIGKQVGSSRIKPIKLGTKCQHNNWETSG